MKWIGGSLVVAAIVLTGLVHAAEPDQPPPSNPDSHTKWGWAKPFPMKTAAGSSIRIANRSRGMPHDSLTLLVKDELGKPFAVGESTVTIATGLATWHCPLNKRGKRTGRVSHVTVAEVQARTADQRRLARAVRRNADAEVRKDFLADMRTPWFLENACKTKSTPLYPVGPE
jgi:hypothetical protein